jgi:hypothetical protein
MFFASIINDYFIWHYTQAWWQMWGVWRNFLFFVIHFFSIPQLMRSWFAPFKRTTQERGNTFDFEDLAAYVIINILSRLFGAIARTAIIIVGILALLLTIIGGFIVYLFWMVAPLMIIGLIGASISLFLI